MVVAAGVALPKAFVALAYPVRSLGWPVGVEKPLRRVFRWIKESPWPRRPEIQYRAFVAHAGWERQRAKAIA